MFSLDLAVVACFATWMFWQMSQVMIIRWSFHGHDGTCHEGFAKALWLREDRSYVLAKCVRVRASFVCFVLTFCLAFDKSS